VKIIPISALSIRAVRPDRKSARVCHTGARRSRVCHAGRRRGDRSRAFTLPQLRARSAFTAKQRGRSTLRPRPAVVRLDEGGFTLIELLVVIAIIIVLTALLVPAFTNMKSAGDVTSAAYTIKGVLDQARTYAMANNTYTWVGFFEENVSTPSTNPATPGTGRIVMSIVASKDGTMLYTGTLSSPVTLDPPNSATLFQVDKLAKIDNAHLKTFAAGLGTGDTFDTRPAVGSTAAQIGNDPSTPSSPSLTFHYPAGNSSPQYTFVKVVQFSPRGEAVIDNSNYTLTTVSEIGVQLTHGITPEPSPVKNPVAVQLSGLGGNVKVYRR
jgi:prepilin-type N-terminal cleavage/methylation domain-containing protein